MNQDQSDASLTDDFEAVAKRCVLEVIYILDYESKCPFCDSGECDDDGGDKLHDGGCPLFGFDMTVDVERLKAWALMVAP